ncbi:hypothetical protein E0Z10_g1850 [Xylaria hypoxylon]|uniref:RING-type domain-containing protein n=1 Tax=Xylaria hypoxylon TaxID=37992 RepID=A0A4Z0Z5L0_9PEZI|nr:hypothetical protein E0Z10_g1850 [Xylaria hypoxylon]
MENFNRAIADGARVVARVAEYQIRQAATSVASTASQSLSSQSTGAPTPGLLSSTGTLSLSSSTSTIGDAMATASDGPTDNSKPSSGGNTSSPLLFFVALGFGVVFTNLWIIVGVKYCFRYNARNRAMARVDENGEPIDLQNMPARPHRRRREKKLMSMDEVNEKFPMVKYKTWVLDRKKEGLPTAGGISAQPSRANSVRSVEGIVPEQTSDTRQSIDESAASHPHEPDRTAQTETKSANKEEQKPSDETANTTPTVGTDRNTTATNEAPGVTVAHADNISTKDSLHRTSEDDEEDDEHIHSALDPDMMGSSGDTCAICIDTLEDDDDVRGLTCGHAFHAVCLDPWLTNRRACCPLCKADYYTPKARPQPAEGETRDPNASAIAPDPSRNHGRLNYPRTPVRSFAWSHFRDAPRQMFPSRFNDAPRDPANMDRRYGSRRQPAQVSRRSTANQAQPATTSEENNGNFVTRFRNRFPPFVLDRAVRNREAQAAEAQSSHPISSSSHPSTTPSQLEAGIRPSTTQPN